MVEAGSFPHLFSKPRIPGEKHPSPRDRVPDPDKMPGLSTCHRPGSEMDHSLSDMRCGLLGELVFGLQNSNLCPGSVSEGEKAVFIWQNRGGRGHPQGREGRASLALSWEASWDGRAPGSDGVHPACPSSSCLRLTPRL